MEHHSSEYSITSTPDGRIDISNERIREQFTEGVTLHLSEIEVFIDRLRQVAGEIRESRPLV